MENEGWIKLYRKFLENPIFTSGDPYLIQLTVYLLLRVNHQEQRILFNRQQMIVPKGSGIFGLNSIVKDLTKCQRENSKQFRKCKTLYYRKLKTLEKIDFLKLQPTNKFTVISITNWEKYQAKNEKCNSSVTQLKLKCNSTVNKQECKECKDNTSGHPVQDDLSKRTIPYPKFKAIIIEYLNKAVEKNFPIVSKVTDKFLKTRYSEGRTVEECKLVIDNRVKRWLGDPERYQFLRPSTLFRPTNFENWITEARAEQAKERASKKRREEYEREVREETEKTHRELAEKHNKRRQRE